METILAIIKEPGEAEDFIVYSANLAQNLHFNLHLAFIQEPTEFTIGQPPPSPAYASFIKAQKVRADNALKTFETYVERLSDEIKSAISIDYSAEYADAVILINDFINNDKAHMVILEEDEGKTFWARSSTEMSVVNNASCPVWVIPHKSKYVPFKEIIYANDYQREDLHTLQKLVEMTRGLSPSITALHVTDNNDFDERVKEAGFDEILRSKIDYRRISVISLKEDKDEHTAQLISGYSQKINADLIVLLKENRSFIEKLFTSDPTLDIIRGISLPVLVYRHK
jgi:nucleotide-binding universal stress UspA family protein